MRRRPSGTPIEDNAEECFQSHDAPEHDKSTIAKINNETLRVQVSSDSTAWTRKPQKPNSTPRARSSAGWKRHSPSHSTVEKSGEEAVLPVENRLRAAMADTRGLWRSRLRSPRSCTLRMMATTAVAVLLVLTTIHSSLTRQLDNQGCVMSRMRPTYIKLSGFDTEHTRFATKYSLYLYREEGVDEYTEDNIGV